MPSEGNGDPRNSGGSRDRVVDMVAYLFEILGEH